MMHFCIEKHRKICNDFPNDPIGIEGAWGLAEADVRSGFSEPVIKPPSFARDNGKPLHFMIEKVGLGKAGDQEQPPCLRPRCS